MTDSVIETRHLNRYFGEGETLVKALDDVSLTIRKVNLQL